MASDSGPTLLVAIDARLDKFEKQLREAGQIADREMSAIEKSISGKDIFAGIGQGIGQGLFDAVQQFAKAIPQLIEQAAKVGDIALAVGLSTDAIQELRFVIGQSGGTAEQADAAMRKFADTVVDAGRGAGSLHKWLEANNVAVKNADGSYRALDAVLKDVTTLIRGARSPQEALNLAVDAFGRQAAPAFVQAARDASQTMEDFRKEAQATGNVLNEDTVAAAKRLNDEWERMTGAIKTLLMTAAVGAGNAFKQTFHDLKQDLDASKNDWRDWQISVLEYLMNVKGQSEQARQAFEALLRPLLVARWASQVREPEGPPLPPPPTAPTKSPVEKTKGESKDGIERAHDALKKRIETEQAELKTIGLGVEAQSAAKDMALLTAAAKKEGLDVDTAITAEMKKHVAEMAQLKAQTATANAAFKELTDWSKTFGSNMSTALKAMIFEGKNFGQVMKQLSQQLAGKAIDKLFDIMFASPAAGGASPVMKLLGIGIPGKAVGGPVGRNQPYVVGERGPELFVPNQRGRIIPNSAMTNGRGDTTINGGNVVVNGNVGDRELDGIKQALVAHEQRIAAQQKAMISSQRFQLTGVS